MSDDLIQRLRAHVELGGGDLSEVEEAADRIEALEAEKRENALFYLSLDTQAQALMDKVAADEALMRQALEALDLTAWHDLPSAWEQKLDAAIAALRARLGESKT